MRGHKQRGGTCWFHSALNGLIMSPLGRRVLKMHLRFVNRGMRLTNIGGRSIFSPNSACPAKTARSALFWDYIRHRLERSRVPSHYVNKNVITSSGLRNSNQVSGGTVMDMYRLYDKLFPGDYKTSFIGKTTPTFVFKFGNVFPYTVIHHGVTYLLSHAHLSLIGPVKSHFVTGFINRNGNPVIYDSAKNKFHRNLRWNTSIDNSKTLERFVKYTTYKKIGVYIRQSSSGT